MSPSPDRSSGGHERSRTIGIAWLAVVLAAGLGSRRYGEYLPGIIAEYAGDTLWGAMFFLLVALIDRRIGTLRAAAIALGICYAIEILQLYHAPWIDAIRAHRLGGLMLGHGFLWSDMLCYTIGVALAALADHASRASHVSR